MEDLLFPVKDGVVTTGFWELRPYSKPLAERTYIHRAWDIAYRGSDERAHILAPENGILWLHVVFRNPLNMVKDLVWDDTHKFYLFSRWYYDTMGAVSVLEGSDTKPEPVTEDGKRQWILVWNDKNSSDFVEVWNATHIHGGQIITGSITAQEIASRTITADNIATATITGAEYDRIVQYDDVVRVVAVGFNATNNPVVMFSITDKRLA